MDQSAHPINHFNKTLKKINDIINVCDNDYQNLWIHIFAHKRKKSRRKKLNLLFFMEKLLY